MNQQCNVCLHSGISGSRREVDKNFFFSGVLRND